MPGENNALTTVLGLLPFVLALGIFVFYLLTRSWREQTINRLDAARHELRSMQLIYQDLQRSGLSYSVEDPEPFGDLTAGLTHALAQFERWLVTLYEQYGTLHSSVRELDITGVKGMLSAPWNWYQLKKNTSVLEAGIKQAQIIQEEAASLANRLKLLGWEVAGKSREILSQAQLAGTIIEQVSQEGMILDPRLDVLWQDIKEWEETILAQVPVVFLSEDEDAVISQADKETTAHIYRVVKGAETAVAGLLAKAEETRDSYESLVQLVEGCETELKRINEKYDSLASEKPTLIRWEKTRALRQRLSQQIESIGPAHKQRSLDQLQAETVSLKGLKDRLADYSENVRRTEDLYRRLMSTFAQVDIEQREEWMRNAWKAAAQVENYHEDNWPRADHVVDFRTDLKSLAEQHEKVVAKIMDQEIAESELVVLLDQLGRLNQTDEKLKARSDAIQKRLNDIAEMEKKSQDPLLRSRMSLAQIISLAGANPTLKKAVGQEADKLTASVEQLIHEMDDRKTGTVEAKTKRVNALLNKIDQSATQWVKLLENEVTGKKKDLAEKISILEAKVNLDEPALNESVRLVKQAQGESTARGSKGTDDTILSLASRLKTANDEWQKCVANEKRIDDFAGAVLEIFSKADQHRKRALERFAKAEEVAPEDLTWPPTTRRITSERNRLVTLEEQWSALQQTPQKAIQAVAALSNLSDGYHSIEMQLGGVLEAAEQEHGRIHEFERRLEESRKMWQRQLQQNSANRAVSDGIEEVISQIDQEYSALKQRYERGSIQYNQALQGMRQLCRKIDDAVVPVDNRQDMDINGVLMRRS